MDDHNKWLLSDAPTLRSSTPQSQALHVQEYKMRSSLFVILSLLSLCSIASEWAFIPGKNLGKINMNSSFKSIQKSYGQANVIKSDIHVGEGFYEKGYILFPNDDNKRAEILLSKEGQPSFILLGGKSSIWHSSEGIKVGTSLQEIEKINGVNFMLSGFAWDYAGTIASWESGKLNKYKGLLTIRLGPKYHQNYSKALLGDNLIQSDNAEMNKLNPTVYQIGVQLKNM